MQFRSQRFTYHHPCLPPKQESLSLTILCNESKVQQDQRIEDFIEIRIRLAELNLNRPTSFIFSLLLHSHACGLAAPLQLSETPCKTPNVGIATINHPFSMVYTTHEHGDEWGMVYDIARPTSFLMLPIQSLGPSAQVASNALITSSGRCGRWRLAEHVADGMAMAAMQPVTWQWKLRGQWDLCRKSCWFFPVKNWVPPQFLWISTINKI